MLLFPCLLLVLFRITYLNGTSQLEGPQILILMEEFITDE